MAFDAASAPGVDLGAHGARSPRDAEIDDPVGLPGTGLVAFGALAFDPRSRRAEHAQRAAGRRRAPRRPVVGHPHHARRRRRRRTPALAPTGRRTARTGRRRSARARSTPSGYQAAVRGGLDAIAAGEVSKVVLARDLVGSVPAGVGPAPARRAPWRRATPTAGRIAVDGIIGASPETLVTVSGGTVTARVLAGTAPRGADADADTAASLALATSAKDQDEHLYAVQSVLASLRPHTSALAASEQPFTLKLPNVFHLATDVEGELTGGASALDLVAALHPTAAVAGTPTDAALEVIRRLEPFDRGRYAGPVGWVDANGDGEWAIALRCAQFDLDDRSRSRRRSRSARTPVRASSQAATPRPSCSRPA